MTGLDKAVLPTGRVLRQSSRNIFLCPGLWWTVLQALTVPGSVCPDALRRGVFMEHNQVLNNSVANMSAVLKYLGGAAATQHPECHCGHAMSFQSGVYPGRTLAFAERPAAAVSGHLGNLNVYPLSAALCMGQNSTLGIFFLYMLTESLTEPRAYQFSHNAWSASTGYYLFLPPYPSCLAFLHKSRNKDSDTHVQEVIYRLSYPSSPSLSKLYFAK